MEYYLCLGTNLGDRKTNLDKAASFLMGLGNILKISSLYETAPVGMVEGGKNFYNMVLCLDSKLTPQVLLKEIKEFEKQMGRDITGSSKLPRIIDIDILLAGDLILKKKNLTIPHEEMHKRAFVLIPLLEIAPDLKHPIIKKSIKDILQNLEPQQVAKI